MNQPSESIQAENRLHRIYTDSPQKIVFIIESGEIERLIGERIRKKLEIVMIDPKFDQNFSLA